MTQDAIINSLVTLKQLSLKTDGKTLWGKIHMIRVSFVTGLLREVSEYSWQLPQRRKPSSSIHTKNKWVSCNNFYPHFVFKTLSLNFKNYVFSVSRITLLWKKNPIYMSAPTLLFVFSCMSFSYSLTSSMPISAKKKGTTEFAWLLHLFSRTWLLWHDYYHSINFYICKQKSLVLAFKWKLQKNVCTVLNFLLQIYRKKLIFLWRTGLSPWFQVAG